MFYKVLEVLEFDSSRKRMSVVASRDGEIFLFVKGADNKVMELTKDDAA